MPSFAMILTVLEIAIGLGMVIFVHELGHFLAAKWCKVRVEAFSIGFGPKIWGFKRGETEYKIAWLPLGGYVKMSGETPADADVHDPGNFMSKPVWQRAVIFSAGVFMNAVFGIVVSILAFQIGVKFQEPRIGSVDKGSGAWEAGMREGDLITEIDGNPVASFTDIQMRVAFADGEMDVRVERDGEAKRLRVRPRYEDAAGFQQIGVMPQATLQIGVKVRSAAAKAGLEDQDLIVEVDGHEFSSHEEFREYVSAHLDQEKFAFTVQRDGEEMKFDVEPEVEKIYRLGVLHGSLIVGVVAAGSLAGELGIESGDVLVSAEGLEFPSFTALEALFREDVAAGRDVARLVVFRRGETEISYPLGSARGILVLEGLSEKREKAWVGGTFEGFPAHGVLRAGDIIVEVDGKEISDWSELSKKVGESEGKSMEVVWLRGGERSKATLAAKEQRQLDFGLEFMTSVSKVRHGLPTSAVLGWRHAVDNFVYVLLTLKAMATAKVSPKNLGGPITIVQASYVLSQYGFGRFIYFLGLLSINLAILNLLPIPILDGAHLVLLLIEKIKGKPLAESIQLKINYVGLVLILGLMIFVFYNDIRRLVG